MSERCDIAVIGAGAVGCAIARHLKIMHPEKDVIVLEKNSEVGSETSRLNSGVIHSGVQENSKFLKARLAKRGSILAVRFAESHQVPIVKCGMLAVASRQSLIGGLIREWRSFWRMVGKARSGSIDARFIFGRRRIGKLEPNLRAFGAVYVPDVWVLDSRIFVEELAADALKVGVRFFFNSGVESISRQVGYWEVSSAERSFSAGVVINAAGLYADDIARMVGLRDCKVYPWRGEYYEIVGEKAKLVSRLIYMVTPPKNSGKGMHLGPRPDGRLFIGPNARPVPSKDYYWQDKTPVENFLEVGQRFCPDLKAEDLRWAYSGIRPKLTPDSSESDFLVEVDSQFPPFVNLIGIESPGLTASMAIGEYVDELLRYLI